MIRLIITTLIAAAAASPPTVRTAQGLVRGVALADARVDVFRGIPYGESTAGAGRWRAPVAKASWAPGATLDATAFGAGCPGWDKPSAPPYVTALNLSTSEDCLYLNVWRPSFSSPLEERKPSAAAAALLPVAVWLHGGGFLFGTGANPVWDGVHYANRTGNALIVVTLNYRLGALGFLPAADAGAANFGLRDQQLALRWVQQNIAAFGGDPRAVMLFGQSAGAMSVLCHLASPLARGLFSRAAAFSPGAVRYRPLAAYAPHAATLSRALGCSGKAPAPANYSCMRAKPHADVVREQLLPEYAHEPYDPTQGNGTGVKHFNLVPWVPAVGDALLPASPLAAFNASRNASRLLPLDELDGLLIGSVGRETAAFYGSNSTLLYEALFGLIFTRHAPAIETRYAATLKGAGAFAAATEASTDYLFGCYTRAVARAAAARGVATFAYEFAHAPSAGARVTSVDKPACLRVPCHASDNMFNFGTADRVANATFTSFERALSGAMRRAVAAFAYGEAAAATGYPRYNATRPVRRVWGGANEVISSTVAGYRAPFCDWWDRLGWIF